MNLKFANLDFEGYQTIDKDGKQNVNIGDFIEFIAIDNLYRKMGISKNDVTILNFYELDKYDGDPVILPINFRLMVDYPQWDIANWSKKIIPVFIGVSLVSTNPDERLISKLKEYEPIGCRDEATYNMLKENGVEAYIAACITLTLERMSSSLRKKNKIFFIDVPEKVKKYIPNTFKGNVEILHHEFFDDMTEQLDGMSCREYTEARLKKYEEEAELIVTSRFHGTISALALGIPVISVLENTHDKFEVLEKIVRVYNAEDGEEINWDPPVVEYQEIKDILADVATQHLFWKYNKAKGMQQNTEELNRKMAFLTDFFKSEKKKEDVKPALLFSEDAKEYVKKNWRSDEHRKIAIWGYSNTALDLLNFLRENYKKIEIVEFYDSFKFENTICYDGNKYLIKEPTEENLDNDYFIFVASNSASKIAESVFDQMGKEDVFCCKLNFITEF